LKRITGIDIQKMDLVTASIMKLVDELGLNGQELMYLAAQIQTTGTIFTIQDLKKNKGGG